MTKPVVGVCGLGMMGSSVARRLDEGGVRVITAGDGRSRRTAETIAALGLEDVGSLDRLVTEADVILSIMGSEDAVRFAGDLIEAFARTGAGGVFAECNLIDPADMRRLDGETPPGVQLLDVGIVGPPPEGDRMPCIYVAGRESEAILFLRDHGFSLEIVGEEVGSASALKLCSAAVWQGCLALIAEVAAAATSYQVGPDLLRDLEQHQSLLYEWFVPALEEAPPRAWRWSGDMQVIARAMASAGYSGEFHVSASRVYSRIASLDLGAGDSFHTILERLAEKRPTGAGRESSPKHPDSRRPTPEEE